MFFVSGITGNTGGAAARQLLAQGHQVRTLARDPQKAAAWSARGVEVLKGDFNEPSAIAAALEGVEGAFLMIPPLLAPAPGFPETRAILASFREALHLAPPPRLVLLSSIGSEQPSGLGLITSTHLMEQALGDLPFPTAFIRAAASTRTTCPPFSPPLPAASTTASTSPSTAPYPWSPPLTSAPPSPAS